MNPRMSASPWLALAALLLLPAARAAEPVVHINADHWTADRARGVSVYTGNVVITRDNMRVTADEARILMREGELEHVTIVGSPARFRQTPQDAPVMEGKARRLEYDARAETAVLTGDAWLRQGGDEIRAASIFVDLETERVTAQSDRATPERVSITLTPRGDPAPEPETAETGENGS